MLYLWIFGDNIEKRAGHGRFLIFYLIFQRSLTSYLCASLPRNALIDCDSVQPRRDLCFATEPTQISERGDECFLCGIACVFLAAKHAVRQRENTPLPSADQFAEGVSVAC